jgi:hypothetical protein
VDALGWAFLALIGVLIVGIVVGVPLVGVALWDVARQRRKRAAREPR